MPRSLPNLLSIYRIATAPVLLGLAWLGSASLFIGAFAASLASDALDGFLARRFRCASELGAKLDSWGDLLTFGVVPVCAWWLWPELLTAQAPFVALVLLSYVAPIALALLKFGRLSSYHTWGAKTSVVVLGAGFLAMVTLGATWLFQLGAFVLLVASLEEMAITTLLDEPQSDVPSVWHARKLAGAFR